MKICWSRLSAIVAGSLCALCAGAGIAQSDVQQSVPQLRMYTVGEMNVNQYEVVSRLWADSWRSAYWIQTFPNREQAIAALQSEAARRGADALLNVFCFDQGNRWKWSSNTEPAFLCHGLAIRVRPGK